VLHCWVFVGHGIRMDDGWEAFVCCIVLLEYVVVCCWGVVGNVWFGLVWFVVRKSGLFGGCCRKQERPYHDDSTASRLLSEVKHRRVR
jgi:hypothetical protein